MAKQIRLEFEFRIGKIALRKLCNKIVKNISCLTNVRHTQYDYKEELYVLDFVSQFLANFSTAGVFFAFWSLY